MYSLLQQALGWGFRARGTGRTQGHRQWGGTEGEGEMVPFFLPSVHKRDEKLIP